MQTSLLCPQVTSLGRGQISQHRAQLVRLTNNKKITKFKKSDSKRFGNEVRWWRWTGLEMEVFCSQMACPSGKMEAFGSAEMSVRSKVIKRRHICMYFSSPWEPHVHKNDENHRSEILFGFKARTAQRERISGDRAHDFDVSRSKTTWKTHP